MQRLKSDIRAAALEDAAHAIDHVVAMSVAGKADFTQEETEEWRDELRRIARVHSENARRVRSKGREASGWVTGEVYEMERRRLDGARAACVARGLVVTLSDVKEILLDREWADPNHQAWLDKAISDDLVAVIISARHSAPNGGSK